MKKIIISTVLLFVIGCSTQTINIFPVCTTIGLKDDVQVFYGMTFVTIKKHMSVSTSQDLYVYLDDNITYFERGLYAIPDSTLYVDGFPFVGLSAFIDTDVNGNWYMQIIRNGCNLSMSVGAKVEIKEFTVRW